MSVSTEVQRTLVKSPPELWTELSNPQALARHLGDFGEIRITKTEPETKVEWEAKQASGVVQLKQSGWGTKVTLSVTRTPTITEQSPAPAIVEGPEPEPIQAVEPESFAAQPERTAVEPEPESEPIPTIKPEAVAAEPEPVADRPELVTAEPEPVTAEPEPVTAEPEPVTAEPEPVADRPEPVALEPEATAGEREAEPVAAQSKPIAPEPDPKPGFFARLFRKRKAKAAAIVEPAPVAVEPESGPNVIAAPDVEPRPEPEIVALAAPEPVYPDPPAQPEASEPAEDLGSELESLEEQMAAETTELLTGVLDRLGAAHHRPFSRG